MIYALLPIHAEIVQSALNIVGQNHNEAAQIQYISEGHCRKTRVLR